LVTLTVVEESMSLCWNFCHRSSIDKLPHLSKTENTA